jgi:hypothetical protein
MYKLQISETIHGRRQLKNLTIPLQDLIATQSQHNQNTENNEIKQIEQKT